MKLKVKNGVIYDMEDETIKGTVSDDSFEVQRVIECGSEALPAIEEFVAEVNSGSFKPRTAVKKFEKLLEKYEI
jgi:hypothetical protein